MQHIIKKQVIDLRLDKKTDSFYLQQLVSEHYWREIVPALQKAFDNASADDEIIQIDKLEIDLGTVSVKDIEKRRWEDDAYKKITAQLSIALADVSVLQKIKRQTTSLSTADQWLFYMQHGYLKWSTLKIDENWHQKILEAFATNSTIIQRLRILIHENPAAVKRIVFQHTENFLETLVETLTAERQNMLSVIIREITEVIAFLKSSIKHSDTNQKKLKQVLWQQVLSHASHKNVTTQTLAEFLLKENIEKPDFIQTLPKKFFAKKRLTAAALEQAKKTIETKKDFSEQKELPINDLEEAEKIVMDDEEIFVQYAGIVLLHPFPHTFFKTLKLISKENFINEAAQEKALHLLHYLATGSIKPEEHELVVAKILCAWHLQKPVTNTIELTEEELNEADALLAEVIQRWEALKNTSPAGLREGFLRRNGKLFTKNDNLNLQVESNSIDVLLDYLPWNINVIMLPWMNDILKIEWR